MDFFFFLKAGRSKGNTLQSTHISCLELPVPSPSPWKQALLPFFRSLYILSLTQRIAFRTYSCSFIYEIALFLKLF